MRLDCLIRKGTSLAQLLIWSKGYGMIIWATLLLSNPNLDNHHFFILCLYKGAHSDHQYVLLPNFQFF